MFLTLLFIAHLLVAYLLGTIPVGQLVARRLGVDLRRAGSGNVGFANATRALGWGPAWLVLAGDIAKGLVPVLLAAVAFEPPAVMVIGGMAILGHIFPIWQGFRGGKGVATGLGVTLGIQPLLVIPALGIYLVSHLMFRHWGLASLTAAWSLPLLCLALAPGYTGFYLGLALLVTWTHRSNLERLRREGLHATRG